MGWLHAEGELGLVPGEARAGLGPGASPVAGAFPPSSGPPLFTPLSTRRRLSLLFSDFKPNLTALPLIPHPANTPRFVGQLVSFDAARLTASTPAAPQASCHSYLLF